MMPQGSEPVLTARLWAEAEQYARSVGFDAAGVAAVPLPGSDEERLQRERFTEWIERGYAGEMDWLKRQDESGAFLRSALHTAVPWVRSVVVCALNYHSEAPLSVHAAPPGSGWIARYAWSGGPTGADGDRPATDYHSVLLRKLRLLEGHMHVAFGEDLQTRCYVDTGPVVERHLAQLAGIGWTGKNTCLLNQELGSWLMLGVVLTSLPLAREAVLAPAVDRCGSCTRCIDACPTDALLAPRQMDASRCIAYLTIEKKGEIAQELRQGMGRQIFGCDICQDVCPWNRRAPAGTEPEMQARPQLVNPSLGWLAAMSGEEFKSAFRGSPLERTGRKRLLRNVAIAMGNSGGKEHLRTLQSWSTAEDTVLAEAAEWALAEIGKRSSDAAAPEVLC